MTLHHPRGEYGSTRFWITDFPVWDVGSNTSSGQDDQRTDFLHEQRWTSSEIHAAPGRVPQIFNRYRSVKLKAITGLTFFYGVDRVAGARFVMGDVQAHTCTAPGATMSRDSLRLAERAELRWVYVPIAPGDKIEELTILNVCTFRTITTRPILLVRIPLALNSPSPFAPL